MLAKASLELTRYLKITLNLQLSCLCFPRAGVAGVCHHAQFIKCWDSNPLSMIDKPPTTKSQPWSLTVSPWEMDAGLSEL